MIWFLMVVFLEQLGDIVDIFPIYDENPIRLEFFGDEIETNIKSDLVTGEILEEIEQVTFIRARILLHQKKNEKVLNLLNKILIDCLFQEKERLLQKQVKILSKEHFMILK